MPFEIKITPYSKKIIVFLVFAFVLLFHVINNYLILQADQAVPAWDPYTNYVQSINLKNMLTGEVSFSENFTKKAYGLRGLYPPLTYLNTAVSFLLLGESYPTAVFSNTFFYVLLLFFFYFAMKLFTDELIAVLMTAYMSFMPGLYRFSRILLPDFILTACVVIAVFFLLRLVRYNTRRDALLFGLACVLGLLAKQSFPLVFLPFMLLHIHKIRFKNLVISTIVVFALAAPWYVFNISEQGLPLWAFATELSLSRAFRFIRRYVSDFYNYCLGAKMFYISCISAIYYAFFVSSKNKSGFLLWFMFSFAFFSFFLNEFAAKYVMPFVVSLVFISGICLEDLKFRKKRKTFIFSCIIIVIVTLVSAVDYIKTSYPAKTPMFITDDYMWSVRNVFEGNKSASSTVYDISELTALFPEKANDPVKIAVLLTNIESEFISFLIYENYRDQVLFDNLIFHKPTNRLDVAAVSEKLKGYDLIMLAKPSIDINYLGHPLSCYSKGVVESFLELIDKMRATYTNKEDIIIKINDSVYRFDILKIKE